MDQVAGLLAGYPFDVLLGSVHWLGAWRFDDLDDPVSMAEWSAAPGRRLLGGVHRGPGGAGGLGGLRRARPPRPDQGGGARPRRAGRVVGPHHRGGGRVGHGRRGLLGRAGASRWASSTRPRRCSSASSPAACRSPRPRTPTACEHVADRADDLRALLDAAGVGTLQGYRGRSRTRTRWQRLQPACEGRN